MSTIDTQNQNAAVTRGLQRGIDAIRQERDTLATNAKAILWRSEGGTLSDEDKTEFERIEGELERLKSSEEWHSSMLAKANAGHLAFERGTPFDDPGDQTDDQRYAGVFGEARRTIDRAASDGLLPDYAAQRATVLVESGSDGERTLAAQWATATGDPAYMRAFAALVADKDRGHLMWTPEESAAYRRAALLRAPLGTGTGAGAELIPLTLDPAIMLTNAGSINPLRNIARVVQTSTNQWQGVTSAGATAEWKAEHVEAADGAPTMDDAPIPVHLGDIDVLYSYEVGMDAMSFLDELGRVLRDAADVFQADAFTTGTGTGQPRGVITGATQTVSGGGAGVLDLDDPVLVQNALPARFSARAQWCGHIATINTIGSFETANGSLRYPEVANGQLLRKPLNELSDMAAGPTGSTLLYGDFQAGFVIVDRIGSTLEILPGYGANQRPTAQRHAFLTFRTGSDVVVPQAFRRLVVT